MADDALAFTLIEMQVKTKMTKEGFLRNNRGINDGKDLDPDFMGALYDRIVSNEIKLKDDEAVAKATAAAEASKSSGGTAAAAAAALVALPMTLVNTLISIVGAGKQQVGRSGETELLL